MLPRPREFGSVAAEPPKPAAPQKTECDRISENLLGVYSNALKRVMQEMNQRQGLR